MFTACTIENNTLGVSIGVGSFGSTFLSTEIAANATQVTDAGTRTFITGNIGGTQQVFGISQTGSVKANSLTMGTASDLGANTINVPNGTAIAGSGTTVALVNTASFEVVGPLVVDQKITSYNGVATVGVGAPSEVASVFALLQTAAIGATALYAVPGIFGGTNKLYRLSWCARIKTAGSVSSTLGPLTITYSDSGTQTLTAAAQIAAGTIATTSTANTTSTLLIGVPMLLTCEPTTNITYAFGYAASSAASMLYDLKIVLEAI